MADAAVSDCAAHSSHLSAAARKWEDRVVASLARDSVSIVTLKVHIDRGQVTRINSHLEENEPVADAPPERRTGPPRNLARQHRQLAEKAGKYLARVNAAIDARAVWAVHTLRAKVEGGRVWAVNLLMDESEPMAE